MPGQVSADKKFGCMTVECLGSCDTAPMAQINEDYAENLTPEKFRDILKKLTLVGKDLHDYSLETVQMFFEDAERAKEKADRT